MTDDVLVEELRERLSTAKERVEFLLGRYPKARECDLYLLILYLRRFTELGKYIKYIPYEVIKKYCGVQETIRRVRQKVQEEGRFLPTDPEVLRKRRRLAEAMRVAVQEV